jgi:hypothetical protein
MDVVDIDPSHRVGGNYIGNIGRLGTTRCAKRKYKLLIGFIGLLVGARFA